MLVQLAQRHRPSPLSKSGAADIVRIASALAVACALAACGGDNATVADAAATEVIEWNRIAGDLVARELHPVQVHAMAVVQIAVHDALNAIEPRYEAYY